MGLNPTRDRPIRMTMPREPQPPASPEEISPDTAHPALDGRKVPPADDPARSEHARVSQGALDVEECEPLVEADRGGKALYQVIDGLGKAA